MTIIPCTQNEALRQRIEVFAEILKTEAHKLGAHGLSEQEFYNSGLLRGAIERIRGQYSATTREKREFVKRVLNHMQDTDFIADWTASADANRHDYSVTLPTGRVAVIELKGCLDGNNTNIFERPPHAEEFIIWSLCTNPGADPRKNAWSGIHTRLSSEIILRSQRVDGLVVWDMVCGTIGRPCPKLTINSSRISVVGPFSLPPPCIYLFPATVPVVTVNPHPPPQAIEDVQILKAFHDCFGGKDDEVNFVDFEVTNRGSEMTRTTRVRRGGAEMRASPPTAIQRT